MPTTKPQYIIAIGASAGGMEEINSFFDHTPLDGVSYVIVQHQSPDFKSRMVELLSKHSKLSVKEAQDEMPLKSNEVYLIPNDKFMTIAGSRLHLTDKEGQRGPHLTINTFFNSLAAECGKKAIAVVLSGLGKDGTEGIKAIKNAGGMVMVRNPDTSEFNSMPSNAIATGLVDFVLEPSLMPGTIEDFVQNDAKLPAEDLENDIVVKSIIELIKEQSPLDFSEYKQPTILRRIKRRAAFNNFIQLDSYLEYLKVTPIEVQSLVQDFLISVTSFFRDKEAFNFIETNVLPAILKNLMPDEEIKFWVAGCATGEEAYSMAILLNEQLIGNYKNTVVKIFATDIDTVALIMAGKGVYSEQSVKNIDAEKLERHFTKIDDNYEIKPHIRKMVIFAQHDLVKNPPYSNMQFISCRNLLIYMTPHLQKKVFLMLLFGLKMDGYLFIGSSEVPTPISEHLDVINKKWKIYKNLETKRVIHFESFTLPQMIDIKHTDKALERTNSYTKSPVSLGESIFETLLLQMDNLTICIDGNNHVIKTYGDTTRFLLQKNFNLNFAELLPRPLALAFNAASIEARKNKKNETIKGIIIKQGNKGISVNLGVQPVVFTNAEVNLLMVTISENKTVQPIIIDEKLFDEKIYFDKYTLMLEEELNELKDKLHATYQQLDASNDNMQSYNEELLSANEEMQSTNEEMQSVNEELHTINAEYQIKNKELLELNDDLNNYFRSNINGQLFVNNDLLLMKFSPGTTKLINLMPHDIGRPLNHLSTNIKFETIVPDLKNVLANGGVITKEIQTDNGKWYQLMTMPYLKQPNNIANGAIITFNDITELKKTQLELDKKNKSLSRINQDLDNFVLTASHDLLAPLHNIVLSIEVMNEIKVADPELNKSIKVINSSVKKFRSLVKNISLVAKIESDSAVIEQVNLEELLKDIEWALADVIQSANAIINKNFMVKQLSFSKKNLRSILYNLIDNGIKYRSDHSPIININTFEENNSTVLSVQDNGIGIRKQDHEKVFNMYGRLNLDVAGQGIGLYLVKKIVDAANGDIILKSEFGEGSNFSIYFKAEA